MAGNRDLIGSLVAVAERRGIGSRHSPRKTSPTRVDTALARFDVIGGTAPARVRAALAAAEGRLGLSATGGRAPGG